MPNPRILVVDDFESFRRFVASTLQQRPGFRIVGEAGDGLDALERARELQPDLILLDIGLPHLNGMDVARRVREVAPAAKILFLTGESDPDVAQEALRLGAGYVHKLRAEIDLLLAIEAVLSGGQFVSPGLEISGGTDDHPHRHEVQFYSDDAVFLDSFAHFIATALKAGRAAIAVLTESHRSGLISRLKARSLDVDAATQQGTFIQLDVAETLSTFMVNGMPDDTRFFEVVGSLIDAAAKAASQEHYGVVACGECSPTLWAEGKTDAAIRVEQLFDQVGKAFGLDILCGYALSSFHGEEDEHVFQSICAEHSAVYTPR